MPYYVYKITPGPTNLIRNLDPLGEFDGYRDAKAFVRTARQSLDADQGAEIRMILADNALDAEERLLEKRERPILQEWEK